MNETEASVGGRLLKFSQGWLEKTRDPWVIASVTHGVAIEFVSVPFQTSPPRALAVSQELEEIGDKEVRALIEKRTVRVVKYQGGGFISSMFFIRKKTRGL